jgi:hypothetical protein
MANRWGIPKEIEELVRKRDLSCVYCRIQFTSSTFSYKSRPTWEHIINDTRLNVFENIALCCCSCNASKGTKQLEAWLKSKYCIDKGITIDSVASIVKKHFEKI